MWLKNERRRNAASVVAWTTTPGENAVNQSWSQQPSYTKIGETLNKHLNHKLAHSRCTNLLQHDKNNQQRLNWYDEKVHHKSVNYPIQKCHSCTLRKISKDFLSAVYKSLLISLGGQTRADVTVSWRMTGTCASPVLDSRSKPIPLIVKASRKWLRRFFHTRYTMGCFGNSWQSLGACTKFLAAEWGDTTPAETVEHGVRGLVDRYLPKKEPGVLPSKKGLFGCPLKEDFFFPAKGSGIPNLERFSHFIDLGLLGEGSGVVKPPVFFPAQGATCTNYICSCQRLDSNAWPYGWR